MTKVYVKKVREITCYQSVHNLSIALSLSINIRSKYAQRIRFFVAFYGVKLGLSQ